jgi:hypothetical protein
MPDYSRVINNLNRKLLFKFTKIRVVSDEEGKKDKTIEELVSGPSSGFGFNFHYSGERYPGVNDKAKFNDPRDAAGMDSEYKTHSTASFRKDHETKGREEGKDGEYKDESDEDDNDSPIQIDLSGEGMREEGDDRRRYDKENMDQKEEARRDNIRRQKEAKDKRMRESEVNKELFGRVQEQGEELAPEPEAPAEDPAMAEAPPEDMGADMGDPMAGGDMSDPGLGDPTMGMPGEEPPKDPNELGRTYEMKKIYARLISMNEYLADERSPRIVKTKISIAKAIDLFAIIGANPESYKEKIDDIIVSYYKFLEAAYRKVKAFYRAEVKRVGGMPLTKNEEQKDDKSMEGTI